MKYLCAFGLAVVLITPASAQDYQKGEYYAPYGKYTGVDATSVDTVYNPPRSASYPDDASDFPGYYVQPKYHSRSFKYEEPYYRPRYYDPWWYRRDSWDHPRWDRRSYHTFHPYRYHGHRRYCR